VRAASRLTSVFVVVLGLGDGATAGADWRSDLLSWREQHEAALLAPDGWLSVAGLYWLDGGEVTFGSGAGADIPLRPPVPALAGRLEQRGEQVRVRLEPGVDAGLGEAGADGWRTLRSDADDEADRLRFGSQRLHVIRRGDRFGVRLTDDETPERRHFAGLRWYPPEESWRIQARFVAHSERKTLKIADVTGRIAERESPGYAVFERGGRQLELHAVRTADPEQLFFIFRDATSGRASYGAGRFLYTKMPLEGVVELDFNRAESPPCAFTAYATCPLPPRSNWLELAVEAGEKDPEVLRH